MPGIGVGISPALKRRNGISANTFIQYSTTGTVTTVGNYKVIILDNNSQEFEVTSNPLGLTMEVLLLPAGGGGGNMGGGGAGNYYHNTSYPAAVKSYAFSIGTKGIGAGITSTAKGTNGGDTTFDGITRTGGGGGGSFDATNNDGAAGGNGGGGGTFVGAGVYDGGIGVNKNGGNGDPSGNGACGGGGGGNLNNGTNAVFASGLANGGQGGNGYLSSITGTGVYYGAGGGGGAFNFGAPGGAGGGGNGATGISTTLATNATAYGSGGGGGYYGVSAGGDGYDGVIIIAIQFQAYDDEQIIIPIGQSNFTDHSGGGTFANLPLAYQPVQRDVMTYYKTVDNSSDNGTWVNAKTGVNTQTGTPQTGYYGGGFIIGLRLRDTYNIKPYIIPTAVGGTYIADDVNPSWYYNHVNQYYNRCVNYHYLPAISKLSFSKSPIFVIVRGESDSDTLAHGLAYEAAQTAEIAQLRADCGYPNAKVIILKIVSTYIGPPNLGLANVRTAIDNIGLADANVHVIDLDALGVTLSDGQHYTDASAFIAFNAVADLIATF